MQQACNLLFEKRYFIYIDQTSDLATLAKHALRDVADALLSGEPRVVAACVRFVCADTQGMWHGRARALMCRRMKHLRLDRRQAGQLVACIAGRLASGRFSEQFKDQLRLAMLLDSTTVVATARTSLSSPAPHVRAYAAWILAPGSRRPQP